MLASMSQIDPPADTPLVDWSELGMSGLTTAPSVADYEAAPDPLVLDEPARGCRRSRSCGTGSMM